MTFLNRVSRALSTSFANAGRTRARLDLLKRSDRFLVDNGFSRELLAQGNDAWPWRTDGIVPEAAPSFVLPPAGLRAPVAAVESSGRNYHQAVAELNAFSDAELSDLGIARAGIVEAVRHGRPDERGAMNGENERQAA